MTTTRKEFSAVDAAPLVLYAKRDANSQIAYPVIAGSDGSLFAGSGLVPYSYDYISLSPPSLPTTIVYKTGGSSGTIVATLTITYSGTDISSVSRT